MNEERKEVCLSGSGGQGLILAGIILAEAAGIYDGFEVVQTQSYGPEARGGTSRSEIIIIMGIITIRFCFIWKISDPFYQSIIC